MMVSVKNESSFCPSISSRPRRRKFVCVTCCFGESVKACQAVLRMYLLVTPAARLKLERYQDETASKGTRVKRRINPKPKEIFFQSLSLLGLVGVFGLMMGNSGAISSGT